MKPNPMAPGGKAGFFQLANKGGQLPDRNGGRAAKAVVNMVFGLFGRNFILPFHIRPSFWIAAGFQLPLFRIDKVPKAIL